MFFRRSKREKQKEASEIKDVAAPATEPEVVETPAESKTESVSESVQEVSATIQIVTRKLDFESTAELEPLSGVFGQDRAMAAIEFAAAMKRGGFHTVVVGPARTGRRTAVREALLKAAASQPAPDDQVYVGSLEPGDRLRRLTLAPGLGIVLKTGISAAIEELKETLPAAFASDEFVTRQRLIDEEARTERDDALAALQQRADAQNIAVLRTPTGYALAPMHEGRVVRPEVFKALPEALRNEVQSKLRTLEAELERILSEAPQSDKARRARLKELHAETSRGAVRQAFEDVRARFESFPEVLGYLNAMQEDIVRNARHFLSSDRAADGRLTADARLRRYAVHVMSTNDAGSHPPLVEDPSPTLASLFGSAEQIEADGSGEPAGWRVTPGSLHKAYGGALLIDARRLLLAPLALEALEHALEDGKIRLISPERNKAALVNAEEIPLDVKVILFAEPDVWRRIRMEEPDFKRLFKVEAIFDGSITRTPDSEKTFARLVASIVRANELKPIDADGVLTILDEASRLAGSNDKLSLEVGLISDLVLEADHWSSVASRATTTRADIEKAMAERATRSERNSAGNGAGFKL
jgi:predicted ATP-dependent protease